MRPLTLSIATHPDQHKPGRFPASRIAMRPPDFSVATHPSRQRLSLPTPSSHVTTLSGSATDQIYLYRYVILPPHPRCNVLTGPPRCNTSPSPRCPVRLPPPPPPPTLSGAQAFNLGSNISPTSDQIQCVFLPPQCCNVLTRPLRCNTSLSYQPTSLPHSHCNALTDRPCSNTSATQSQCWSPHSLPSFNVLLLPYT
jgi:hypothetical protein